MGDELQTDAIETLLTAYTKRVEYEVRGAYRAGYSYLYVGQDRSATTNFKTVVFPADSDTPPADVIEDAARYRWYRYELDALPTEEYRRAVHDSPSENSRS